ncbi:hypothetical protein Hanom_Chr09g00769051 [Helianthus anomalus]
MQSTPGFIEPLEHHLLYLFEDPIILLMASRVGEKAVAPSTVLVTGLQQTSVSPLVIQVYKVDGNDYSYEFMVSRLKNFDIKALKCTLPV